MVTRKCIDVDVHLFAYDSTQHVTSHLHLELCVEGSLALRTLLRLPGTEHVLEDHDLHLHQTALRQRRQGHLYRKDVARVIYCVNGDEKINMRAVVRLLPMMAVTVIIIARLALESGVILQEQDHHYYS